MRVVNTSVNSEQLTWLEERLPSQAEKMERAMGFEPTTSCLGSKHSTPELRPLNMSDCTTVKVMPPKERGEDLTMSPGIRLPDSSP